jgi:hypothetical protein
MSLVAVAIRSAPRLVTRFPPYCCAFSGNHLHTVGFLADDDQQSTLAGRLTLKAAAAAFNVTFSIVIWLAKVSRLRKLKSGILVKVHLFDSLRSGSISFSGVARMDYSLLGNNVLKDHSRPALTPVTLSLCRSEGKLCRGGKP